MLRNKSLYCRILGKGQPLVLLHGMFGSSNDWESLVPELAQHYTLIIPDLPGFGKSRTFSLDSNWGYQQMLAVLLEQLDSLPISKCHWLGYSLGGRLALYAACQYPERVTSLILLGAGPGLDDPQQRADRLQLDQTRAQKVLDLGVEGFLNSWYQAAMFAPLYGNKAIFDDLFKRRILENSPEWAAKLMVELSPGIVPSLWSYIAKLKMPLCYMVGELDEKFNHIATKIKSINPSVDVQVVANAGHSLHLEQPERFLEVLYILKRDRF